MRSLDITEISIPDSETTFLGASLTHPHYRTNLTEFIEGTPLSSDKKIDQIRLNVLNAGFFKLHPDFAT